MVFLETGIYADSETKEGFHGGLTSDFFMSFLCGIQVQIYNRPAYFLCGHSHV